MKMKTLTVGRMCFAVFLVLSLSGLPFFTSASLAQPKVPAGVAFSLPVASGSDAYSVFSATS